MFGLQTPELKRATDYESILQSTQQELGEEVNNPAVLYPALQQKLAQAGFTREAIQVGMVGQKAIQEAGLNQAKIMTEQAQLAKATQEKLPEIVRLQAYYKQAMASGDMETANAIKAQIEKNTNIPEKTLTPQNRAEEAKLNQFIKQFGDEDGATRFLEWKNQLEQKKSAVQGTGTILADTGKPIGAYDEKGAFTSAKGEVIPKEQMVDFRDSQIATGKLLDIMSTISLEDINNAFGKPDVTQGGVVGSLARFAANPEITSSQVKINSLGVKEVLTNLQQLKGASSDREMSRMASTFPGYEAPPKVMQEWLARALLASTKFLNKNKEKYGFDAPNISIEDLANIPLLKALPAKERTTLVEGLLKYDTNFKQLPEQEQIRILNNLANDGTGGQTTTPKQTTKVLNGKTYINDGRGWKEQK
jgi:hypothetical protein